jgi:hypothetical protein
VTGVRLLYPGSEHQLVANFGPDAGEASTLATLQGTASSSQAPGASAVKSWPLAPSATAGLIARRMRPGKEEDALLLGGPPGGAEVLWLQGLHLADGRRPRPRSPRGRGGSPRSRAPPRAARPPGRAR